MFDFSLAVYLRFLNGRALRGREILYVQGWNDDKLLVRKGGRVLPFVTISLAPDSAMAMDGNRFPITVIGASRPNQPNPPHRGLCLHLGLSSSRSVSSPRVIIDKTIVGDIAKLRELVEEATDDALVARALYDVNGLEEAPT